MTITNGFSIDLLDGQTVQLHLTGTYTDGSTADITELATWSVPFFDADILSVSNNTGNKGFVSTLGVGDGMVLADYSGIAEVIFINVK